MSLLSLTQASPLTPGLEQFAFIIRKERGILKEYAAKQNANPKHVEIRNRFLLSLTETYNLIYSEVSPVMQFRFYDSWLAADQQASALMEDTNLDGVYIKLKLRNGSNYGLITL